MLRNIFALFLMTLLLCSALYIYWEEEFKYFLPVEDQQGLPINTQVMLSYDAANATQPTYFHFFDKGCKNARINMDHLAKIIAPYQENFNFVIVVQDASSKEFLLQEYRLPGNVHIVADKADEIRKKLKIQTTPYAAILDIDNTLYF